MARIYALAFGVNCELIGYGTELVESTGQACLEHQLQPGNYFLVVARPVPENNVSMIVNAHQASGAERPLVIVGDTEPSEQNDGSAGGVRWLGPIYDSAMLNDLYASAAAYCHGHSVGGVNPSLIRAMGAGTQCIALKTPFNREALGDAGAYFADAKELSVILKSFEKDDKVGQRVRRRAQALFSWDQVAEKYAELCERIARSSD